MYTVWTNQVFFKHCVAISPATNEKSGSLLLVRAQFSSHLHPHHQLGWLLWCLHPINPPWGEGASLLHRSQWQGCAPRSPAAPRTLGSAQAWWALYTEVSYTPAKGWVRLSVFNSCHEMWQLFFRKLWVLFRGFIPISTTIRGLIKIQLCGSSSATLVTRLPLIFFLIAKFKKKIIKK